MSTRKRLLALIACAAITLGLPLASGVEAKTKNGCKAITTADVNAAFADVGGGDAPDGIGQAYKGYTSCTWNFPNGTLFIGLDKVSKVAKQDFNARKKAPGASKVKGLKKSFYAGVETGEGGTVTFIDGTTFVNLQYFTTGDAGDPDALKDALVGLAKKAAKKL